VTAAPVTTHDLWIAASEEREPAPTTVSDLRQQLEVFAADRDAGYAAWGEFCLAWVSVLCEERDQAQYDLDAVSRQLDEAAQAGAALVGELIAVARVLDNAGAPGAVFVDRVLSLATSRRRLARSMGAAIAEREQYRRDLEATSGRAVELAARVSELERVLARLAKQRAAAELIARNALATGDTEARALRKELAAAHDRIAELEAERANGRGIAGAHHAQDDANCVETRTGGS
jgi:hypothetical protein